jgi:hypothetical protein
MRLSKIPVPADTWLVEIVTDDGSQRHMIYFLNNKGELVDCVHVADASIREVCELIPHMFVVHFTPRQMWEVNCACMFNQIFEPDIIPYDRAPAWQMNAEMVEILRHFGKIINVANYRDSDEYADEVHILDDFIYARPTPIERKDEDVHRRGVESRRKFLDLVRNFVL